MSYWLSLIAGATLAMFILSWLISLVVYKRFEPIQRAVATVLTAYGIAVLVYGSQDGGQYIEAMLIYGVGAVIVFFERKRRYEKHWVDEKPSEWYETFR